jgi:hypothetical protein
MQKFNGSLVRQFPSLVTGNAAAGVSITVFVGEESTTEAVLYDDSGLQIDNPIVTDAAGYYGFKAQDGLYRLSYDFPSVPDQIVQIFDINSLKSTLQVVPSVADTLEVDALDHAKMFICSPDIAEAVTITVGEAAYELGIETIETPGASIIFKQQTVAPLNFEAIEGVTVDCAGEPQTNRRARTVALIAQDRYTWVLVGDFVETDGI